MFGIKQTSQIIEGHFNELTNRENDLYESRIKICKECPLYAVNSLGEVCNSKKCYNKETGELQDLPGKGFICGCGCRLKAALRTPSKKCVLGKF